MHKEKHIIVMITSYFSTCTLVPYCSIDNWTHGTVLSRCSTWTSNNGIFSLKFETDQIMTNIYVPWYYPIYSKMEEETNKTKFLFPFLQFPKRWIELSYKSTQILKIHCEVRKIDEKCLFCDWSFFDILCVCV